MQANEIVGFQQELASTLLVDALSYTSRRILKPELIALVEILNVLNLFLRIKVYSFRRRQR